MRLFCVLPFILTHVDRRRIRHRRVPRGDAPIVAPDSLKPRRRIQRVSNLRFPVFIRRDQPRSRTMLARDPPRALTNRINHPQARQRVRLRQNRVVHQIVHAVKRSLRLSPRRVPAVPFAPSSLHRLQLSFQRARSCVIARSRVVSPRSRSRSRSRRVQETLAARPRRIVPRRTFPTESRRRSPDDALRSHARVARNALHRVVRRARARVPARDGRKTDGSVSLDRSRARALARGETSTRGRVRDAMRHFTKCAFSRDTATCLSDTRVYVFSSTDVSTTMLLYRAVTMNKRRLVFNETLAKHTASGKISYGATL